MRRVLIVISLIVTLTGCSTSKRMADNVWAYAESHPDGFTVTIPDMKAVTCGISVSYNETQNSFGRKALKRVLRHAKKHEHVIGGWFNEEDAQYYFDSNRIFSEDSLEAAKQFGIENGQQSIYVISKDSLVRLLPVFHDFERSEEFSPSTLIIMYDNETGKEPLMEAVKKSGAELIYDYNIIPGIAIRIPKNMTMSKAILYFKKVKGVIAVERDHINHLMDSK